MDTRDTSLPRWARIVIYGIAIAAFFWLVPAIREPERLKIFAPAAIALFLFEGLVSHLRDRGYRWDLRLPVWAHLILYYSLSIGFVVALPWLRQMHAGARFPAILLAMWGLRALSHSGGASGMILLGPFAIMLFATFGLGEALSRSREELGIAIAYLSVSGASWAVFWVRHQKTVMRKSYLILATALWAALAGLLVYLVRLNFTVGSNVIRWLTWPPIGAIVVVFSLLLLFPLWFLLTSKAFRMAARLEYRVANGQWDKAQELWPEARLAAIGHPLEWSFEVDLLNYQGQIRSALGDPEGAIRSWELGLEKAEQGGDPIEFRLIGDNLAAVYEEQGRWSELARLLPRLIMSWSSAGRKGHGPILRLMKQQQRIPSAFVLEDEDDWECSSTYSS